MNNDRFPLEIEEKDRSPVMTLFGKRFFSDQNPSELLSELLLVMFSPKRINEKDKKDEIFPIDYPDSIDKLEYKAEYRLLLKLLCLFPNAKGSTSSYLGFEEKRLQLVNDLASRIVSDGGASKDNKVYVDILTTLYQGFHTVGSKREWSAQSFLPISKYVIAGESKWYVPKKKKPDLNTPYEGLLKYFDHRKHLFYGRGGEVLYLELFAAFLKSKNEIEDWLRESKLASIISEKERDPAYLQKTIQDGIEHCYEQSRVLEFFPKLILEVDATSQISDEYTRTGDIPESHWKYGYIFAVELSRLLQTSVDLVDMIRLLELECVMQVLRVMLRASSEYLGYKDVPLIPVVSPEKGDSEGKRISNAAFSHCLMTVKDAVDKISGNSDNKSDQDRYGFKLFRKLAKSIGFVVPPKGDNEHFVLTKDLVHLIVVTSLLPGERLSFETFLAGLKIRYGIVFDNDGFNEANRQNGLEQIVSDPDRVKWFTNMLDEAGYFIELSDSLSLIKNTNNGV